MPTCVGLGRRRRAKWGNNFGMHCGMCNFALAFCHTTFSYFPHPWPNNFNAKRNSLDRMIHFVADHSHFCSSSPLLSPMRPRICPLRFAMLCGIWLRVVGTEAALVSKTVGRTWDMSDMLCHSTWDRQGHFGP